MTFQSSNIVFFVLNLFHDADLYCGSIDGERLAIL